MRFIERKLEGVEKLSSLSKQDLKFLVKLGFHKFYVQLARKYGQFKVGDYFIEWNTGWELERPFFFEISRDSLPFGRTLDGNIIYLINIRDERSQVAILHESGECLKVVSANLVTFLLCSEKDSCFTDRDVRLMKSKRVVPTKPSIQFNLNDLKVDDIYDLYPFGKETSHVSDPRSGHFVAKRVSKVEEIRAYKKKNLVSWAFLALFTVILFSIGGYFNLSIIYQLAFFSVVLILAPSFFMVLDKIRGRWKRL